jgi:hypothetical protein
MALNPMIIEVIWEVIAPSKENSPLKSAQSVSKATQTGVSRFWLGYVTGLVDRVLQKQIWKISEHRVQSDRFYTRLAKKDTPHEYSDLNPKTLLRIIGSYVRKSELKDKYEDHTRLSAIEAYELEKLYEFIKTEDGRQLLHEGIIDVMDIKSESLSPEDIEKLNTLQFSSFREEVSALDEKMKKAAEFSDSVAKSWNYVDEYVRYIRGILIWYYQKELLQLGNNFNITTGGLMTRTIGREGSYPSLVKLAEATDIFRKSHADMAKKLETLIKEDSADSLNRAKKVTIVVQK